MSTSGTLRKSTTLRKSIDLIRFFHLEVQTQSLLICFSDNSVRTVVEDKQNQAQNFEYMESEGNLL